MIALVNVIAGLGMFLIAIIQSIYQTTCKMWIAKNGGKYSPGIMDNLIIPTFTLAGLVLIVTGLYQNWT